MEKALREAKRNTNWVDQNEAWETGVRDFCAGPVLATARSWMSFEPFVAELAATGDADLAGHRVPEADRARRPRHLPG